MTSVHNRRVLTASLSASALAIGVALSFVAMPEEANAQAVCGVFGPPLGPFATGTNSFACGTDGTDANVIGALAEGTNTTAVGQDAEAFGDVNGDNAWTLGTDTTTNDATAVGAGSSATTNNTTAVGSQALASGQYSTAVGARKS